ncbi:hypothetical protein EVAR_89018_1 [Eumeta japonica]|uniref:Uncharacterized protein n=1 Tax=Eumeta variegata TaxID=151549 RepID=A0A4C1XCA0_EUMVA|nr:hypothetical protein EVAR_89018_1 [Eumeta japonica]
MVATDDDRARQLDVFPEVGRFVESLLSRGSNAGSLDLGNANLIDFHMVLSLHISLASSTSIDLLMQARRRPNHRYTPPSTPATTSTFKPHRSLTSLVPLLTFKGTVRILRSDRVFTPLILVSRFFCHNQLVATRRHGKRRHANNPVYPAPIDVSHQKKSGIPLLGQIREQAPPFILCIIAIRSVGWLRR